MSIIYELIQYKGKRFHGYNSQKGIIDAVKYLHPSFSSGESIIAFNTEDGSITIIEESDVESAYTDECGDVQ